MLNGDSRRAGIRPSISHLNDVGQRNEILQRRSILQRRLQKRLSGIECFRWIRNNRLLTGITEPLAAAYRGCRALACVAVRAGAIAFTASSYGWKIDNPVRRAEVNC